MRILWALIDHLPSCLVNIFYPTTFTCTLWSIDSIVADRAGVTLSIAYYRLRLGYVFHFLSTIKVSDFPISAIATIQNNRESDGSTLQHRGDHTDLYNRWLCQSRALKVWKTCQQQWSLPSKAHETWGFDLFSSLCLIEKGTKEAKSGNDGYFLTFLFWCVKLVQLKDSIWSHAFSAPVTSRILSTDQGYSQSTATGRQKPV